MMTVRTGTLLLCFALASVLRAQEPQTPKPIRTTEERAHEFNEKGVGFFEEGKLDEAISRFEYARALLPKKKVFAVNLGRALHALSLIHI